MTDADRARETLAQIEAFESLRMEFPVECWREHAEAVLRLSDALEAAEARLAFTLAWFNISREALDKVMAERHD